MRMCKDEQRTGAVVEALEGRRLMTAVIGEPTFDPIVGPVGPTPGSIGWPSNVEPVAGPSGTLPPNGNGFFLGFGGGQFVVGASFGTALTLVGLHLLAAVVMVPTLTRGLRARCAATLGGAA